MKKMLTILMSLVLVFGLTVNVFACTIWNEETAWAISNNKLNTILDNNKWGWYMAGEDLTGGYDVYAGVGQNEPSNLTPIGLVIVKIVDGHYSAEFISYGSSYVTKMHFGVYNSLDDLKATKGAPGRFTNAVNADTNATQYMVIHFDAEVAQN